MSYGFCTGEIKLIKSALEGIMAGVPKALMPQISRRRGTGQQRLSR